MHVLRWRRGWFVDEVLFDERRVATATGLFGRETIFGLAIKAGPDDKVLQLLFTIDPEEAMNDWSGEGRPRGVRLETADAVIVAYGTLKARTASDRADPFRALYDQAIKAIGLS